MMMFRVLAIVGVAALSACSGDRAPMSPVPAVETDPGGIDTPNSLPGSSNLNSLNDENGVVGVRHSVP
jgi:hypothetical protein